VYEEFVNLLSCTLAFLNLPPSIELNKSCISFFLYCKNTCFINSTILLKKDLIVEAILVDLGLALNFSNSSAKYSSKILSSRVPYYP
jgi:hypothetical protein